MRRPRIRAFAQVCVGNAHLRGARFGRPNPQPMPPGGKRTPQATLRRIVQPFTNVLEWRCLDQIRAPIQEWCVAYLPN